MGCLQSKGQDPATDVSAPPQANGTEKHLHQLVRPDIYKDSRPSFYAAYARAARRYGFETGRYAGFAKRNNVVVKVRSLDDKGTDHEVPAESIQNGGCRCPRFVAPSLTYLARCRVSLVCRPQRA